LPLKLPVFHLISWILIKNSDLFSYKNAAILWYQLTIGIQTFFKSTFL